MAEVIYTRESTGNTRNESRNEHDESIEEFIKEMMERAMFLNEPAFRDKFHYGFEELGDAGIVGSSIDGTQLGVIFNIGDHDSLIFSPNLTFDVDDELLFEYRDDDPHFLRIPQPKQLENKIPAVDGIYMSAHDLRFFREPLFNKKTSRNYVSFPYNFFPIDEEKSLHKCATTRTFQHVPHVEEKSSTVLIKAMRRHTYSVWMMEHLLLTYLLHLRNENELQFVRELLLDDFKGDCQTVREHLESSLCSWKKDLQKALFSSLNISYFNGGDFRKRLESVCQQSETQFDSAVSSLHGEKSVDLVPAIKCSGWPRPAIDWMNRPRQWPDENVVEDIVSSGFQLVAKSPPIDPTPEKRLHSFIFSIRDKINRSATKHRQNFLSLT